MIQDGRRIAARRILDEDAAIDDDWKDGALFSVYLELGHIPVQYFPICRRDMKNDRPIC